jgi:hypothetical protein
VKMARGELADFASRNISIREPPLESMAISA